MANANATIHNNDHPVAGGNFIPYAAPFGSFNTREEGTRTGAAHPRETQNPHHPGRGQTYQRVNDAVGSAMHNAVGAAKHADLTAEAQTPRQHIPYSWWRTFLPVNRFDAVDNNHQRIYRDTPALKTDHHFAALEALGPQIAAPTRKDLVDQAEVHHKIVANARPLLLYKRTNTLDTPAAGAGAKRCAYGKIRDQATNSWRCIKNPNHHSDFNM